MSDLFNKLLSNLKSSDDDLGLDLEDLAPKGLILLDKPEKKILASLKNLKKKLADMETEGSEERAILKECLQEIKTKVATLLSKGRDQQIYNTLQEVRSTLDHLESHWQKLTSELKERDQLVRTLREDSKQLRGEFIFKNKIKPGVFVMIRARDHILDRLRHLPKEASSSQRSFLEALGNHLLKGLENFQINEIEVKSQAFDPQIQEVVGKEQVSNPDLENKVLEVKSPGYRHMESGKVLRPQKVKIGTFSGGVSNE